MARGAERERRADAKDSCPPFQGQLARIAAILKPRRPFLANKTRFFRVVPPPRHFAGACGMPIPLPCTLPWALSTLHSCFPILADLPPQVRPQALATPLQGHWVFPYAVEDPLPGGIWAGIEELDTERQ